MLITISILAVTIIMFVIGKIRADVVALCSLTLLIFLGILTPSEALAGFSSPVIIMMVGLFVVGGAILQTGLAKAASQKIMKMAGNNDTRMFLMVILVTAVIGAFVSNTGTVALMMPIVVSLATQSKKNVSTLLMPLAFASSMGGMLTLIGTPPNLVIDEALREQGFQGLSFFSFFPVGVVCLIVGIAVMLPLSRFFLQKKNQKAERRGKTLEQLVNEYRIVHDVEAFRVDDRSGVVGTSIADLNLRVKYGINIVEIRTDVSKHKGLIRNVTQDLPSLKRKLEAGDILYLQGDKKAIDTFVMQMSLYRIEGAEMEFFDLGVAEIVVMPQSRLVGTLLRDSRFREQYNVNILGIKRGKDYITDQLPEEKLHAGDTLLIQGKWEDINRIDTEEDDWVLLGQPQEMAAHVTLDYKAPLAAFIMLMMVAAMVFDFIPIAPVTAVMAAGLLMVVSGCFRSVDAAYKTINWESIVLIAAMMPMATALEKTGASALLSHSLVSGLGSMSPIVLLCGVYFTTSLLTMFISNTATAVLMAPIAMSAATEMGLSPYPFLFAVTLGASMCFASPFSTPPNALVMHAGNYSFSDYVKVGLPLQIIMGIVMTFVLPLLFPF